MSTLGETSPTNSRRKNPGAAPARFLPRADIWIALLLGAIAFLAYWPSLKSDFVYDARREIFEEGFITSPANIPYVLSFKVLGTTLMLGDRPGQLLYMMLIATVAGKNPFLYHLGSNLLHAANVALLFILLSRLVAAELPYLTQIGIIRVRFAIAAATLIFALHPIAVESVAEISYSSVLLVTFFSLIALLTATFFHPENFRSAILTGTFGSACIFGGITSKESGITAIMLLAAYVVLFRFQDRKTPWLWFLGACAAVTAAFLAARFLMAPPGRDVYRYIGGSLGNVFLIQPRIWVFMMGQLIWPANLSADYTANQVAGISTLRAIVILAMVLSGQVWLAMRSKVGALGVAMYWLSLVTVSNFIPIYRFVADRFYYMSLAGMAAQLLAILLLTRRYKDGFWLAIAPVCLLLLPLTILTIIRQDVFANEYNLWSATVQASPKSAIAHNNLGNAFRIQGQVEEAMAQYQIAVGLDNDYAKAQNNLANSLFRHDRLDEALVHYQKSITLQPNVGETHDNYGMLLAKLGRTDEAIAEYQKSIALDPRFPDSHTNLGIILSNNNRFDEAIAQFQEVLRLRPGDRDAQKNLSLALQAAGLK